MTTVTDLNREGEEIILSLANVINEQNVPLQDVYFDAPIPSAEPGKNSSVQVNALPDSKTYKEYQVLHYERVDIARLFEYKQVLVTGGIHDHNSAIELVNRDHGIRLKASAIWQSEVDADGRVELKIKQDLIYLPNTKISVVDEFDFSLGVFDNLLNVSLADAAIPGDQQGPI